MNKEKIHNFIIEFGSYGINISFFEVDILNKHFSMIIIYILLSCRNNYTDLILFYNHKTLEKFSADGIEVFRSLVKGIARICAALCIKTLFVCFVDSDYYDPVISKKLQWIQGVIRTSGLMFRFVHNNIQSLNNNVSSDRHYVQVERVYVRKYREYRDIPFFIKFLTRNIPLSSRRGNPAPPEFIQFREKYANTAIVSKGGFVIVGNKLKDDEVMHLNAKSYLGKKGFIIFHTTISGGIIIDINGIEIEIDVFMRGVNDVHSYEFDPVERNMIIIKGKNDESLLRGVTVIGVIFV